MITLPATAYEFEHIAIGKLVTNIMHCAGYAHWAGLNVPREAISNGEV